tara:strand:- start:89 stop:520 length:432 start_codon:yes stop_codon:yes gene_type:complete
MKYKIFFLLVTFNSVISTQESFKKYDDGFYCGDKSKLEMLQIKMGSTIINNFFIQETSSWMVSSSRVAKLNYTATNRSSNNTYINLQIMGFDKEDFVIFAMSGGPILDVVAPNSAVSDSIDTYVNSGVVNAITEICIGAFGGS